MTHHGARCAREESSKARRQRVAKESCSQGRLRMEPGDKGLHQSIAMVGYDGGQLRQSVAMEPGDKRH